MKNKNIAVAIAAAFFAFACENQQDKTISQRETVAEEEHTTDKSTNNAVLSPEEFTKKAFEYNMKEVQLAKVAVQQSTDKEVKDFAQKSMKEHKKANNLLLPIAKIKKINTPTVLPESHMVEINKLKEKSGADFSKEYIDKVIEMHEESIDLYTQASEKLEDPVLSKYATQSLHDLQRHLDEAKSIQKNLKERPASLKK